MSKEEQLKKILASYVPQRPMQCRSDGEEWHDASKCYPTEISVKKWQGEYGDLKKAKELLKVWDTPEMKAKAKEAALYHDEIHGDDSDDYDDD